MILKTVLNRTDGLFHSLLKTICKSDFPGSCVSQGHLGDKLNEDSSSVARSELSNFMIQL